MTAFKEILTGRIPLLFDGAIGTELYNRGIFINRCFEEANLTSRGMVLELHNEYRKAGANVLTTNSWGANRYKLKEHNLQEQVRAINLEAARIAGEAAGDELYVAGSVGPLGVRMEPWSPVMAQDAYDAYREQVGGLIDGGVDLIILETFREIHGLEHAIKAIKSLDPAMPICTCLTINLAGEMDSEPGFETAVQKIIAWGSDIIGLNCSVGPQLMVSAVKKLKAITTLPLIVQPNAGLPKAVDGRLLYMSTPEYFAEHTKYFLQEGVQFVGGCCGTGSAHIRAMAQILRQHKAMSRAAVGTIVPMPEDRVVAATEVPAAIPRIPFEAKSGWTKKIAAGIKVVAVELVPPSGITAAKLLDNARLLKNAGIDAINIPDGPRASSKMSTVVTAILVEQQVGIETILHYTCRDRNLIGMQSDMLGAHAIGLRNILFITGDPPKLGDYPDATGVFDVDSIGLTRMAQRLNGGIDIGSKPIGEPTALSIGVGVNPAPRDFEFEMDRFRKKLDAGAEWAITQPIFDVCLMESFLEYLAKHGLLVPIIMGIWPLTSLKNARFMHNEVPGIQIPDSIMTRMAEAQTPQEAQKTGVTIAREMYSTMIDKVQGVQLSAPFGRVDLALRILGE